MIATPKIVGAAGVVVLHRRDIGGVGQKPKWVEEAGNTARNWPKPVVVRYTRRVSVLVDDSLQPLVITIADNM